MNHNGRIKKEEFVVLVDETDRAIGIAPKATVHTEHTPLHRAFSLYIFNPTGKVLVQQRKKEKITWGGFWSNSCCGHPMEKELREEAAQRRAKQELGINVKNIAKIEDYRYRFERNNVVENEICPIFAGTVLAKEIQPDPEEIENAAWVTWLWLVNDMKQNGGKYSPWSKEQVEILSVSPRFQEWLRQNDIGLSCQKAGYSHSVVPGGFGVMS